MNMIIATDALRLRKIFLFSSLAWHTSAQTMSRNFYGNQNHCKCCPITKISFWRYTYKAWKKFPNPTPYLLCFPALRGMCISMDLLGSNVFKKGSFSIWIVKWKRSNLSLRVALAWFKMLWASADSSTYTVTLAYYQPCKNAQHKPGGVQKPQFSRE